MSFGGNLDKGTYPGKAADIPVDESQGIGHETVVADTGQKGRAAAAEWTSGVRHDASICHCGLEMVSGQHRSREEDSCASPPTRSGVATSVAIGALGNFVEVPYFPRAMST